MRYIRSMLLGSVKLYAPEDEKGAAAGDQEDKSNSGAADQGGNAEENKAEAGAEDNSGAAAGEGTEDEKGAAATDDKAKPKQDWKDKEIGRKHRQLREKDDEIALLKRRNAELEAGKAAPAAGVDGAGDNSQPNQRKGETDAEFEARVQAEANRRVALTIYQRDMQEIDTKGKKDYGDGFSEALMRLDQLGGFDEATMAAIRATDDPARVIFEMGSKPENYQRVMEIVDPMKRALAIYEMAKAPKPKAKVSEAPAPVDAIGSGAGAGSNAKLDDKMSDEAWYTQRRKEKLASQGRPWSTQR